MSFKINLYSFAKDSNSTAQPAGSGTELTCNILSPADIIAPLVEIKHTDPTAFNYAYIAAFHRYYFIEGITYNEGLWILNLRCDVLATYKTEIGAQSLYVLRAASVSDGNVQDNFYPPTASVTKRHQYQVASEGIPGYQIPPGESEYRFLGYDGGYIVLNIAGTGTAGATTLILMTTTDFKLLVAALYTAIDGFQFGDVIKSVVQKFGGNPQELINNAMWVPWAFTGDNYDVVQIGSWKAYRTIDNPDWPSDPDPYIDVPINGLYIDNAVIDPGPITFNIHKHPQAATRGNYLNLAPYTSYIMGVPGCGVVSLDASKLIGETAIQVQRTIDAFTGQYQVDIVTSGGGQILAHLTGQMGVPITLRGSNNVDKVVGNILETAGRALEGDPLGYVSAGIGTLFSMTEGTPTSTGMGAGFAEILGKPIWMDTLHYAVTDEDNTHNGRPLMQAKTISTLSGYIQVQKGDVPIAGTSQEADEIRSLLEGGFYYE